MTKTAILGARAEDGTGRPAFREMFCAWLAENLPAAWRGGVFGMTDEAMAQRRRDAGRALGVGGWLNLTWPAFAGGQGLSAEHRLVVLEELVRANVPEPMNANAIGIFAPTLIKFGTSEQCAAFLPAMVSHDEIWCQGFSEPGAGSDLAAIATRAHIDGDEIVISGQKVWTSYAHLADYCYIVVRTERGAAPHAGLSLVMLPMHQPGVSVSPLQNMIGTDEFCEVFLDEARAPLGNLVGRRGQGWQMAMYALSQERSVGLAQRSLKLAAEFDALAALLREEADNGNPRVTPSYYEQTVVDAFVRSRVVAASVAIALELDGAGADLRSVASVAKLFWSESHQQQLAIARDVLGQRFVSGDPVGRDWYRAAMWARAETIYGGTTQIQKNVLARVLGMPRPAW